MRIHSKQIIAICILLVSWAPAHAYLDPGTGSVLIQGLIAAVAAAGVTARLYWHRITGFFSSKKGKDAKPSEQDSSNQ